MKGCNDNNSDKIDVNNIIDQIPGNIYWKSKDGTLLGCNKKTLNDFGLASLENYIGKTDYHLFPKEQADKLTQVDKEVIHTGKTIITEEESDIHDGSTALYLSYKSPLKNTDGEIIGIAGISLDITSSNQKKIKELNLLENIISLIPGHVYWKDKKGNYLGCNNEQARALGLSSNKDIVNKKPYENLSIDEANSLREGDNKVLLNGQTITLEEPGIRENGETGTFLTKKTPLYNQNGQIVGLLGVSFDITKRKINEESLKKAKEEADIARQAAEESMLAKNEFIKNIEHDLRTPFSGILSIAEILWNDEQDNHKKEALHDIVCCARELLDYHNRVIHFSNVMSGSLPVIKRKFNLKNLMNSIIDLESPAAISNKLKINYNFSYDVPEILLGDEYRVQSIIINIVSNAIKFTSTGEVTINVTLFSIKERDVIIRFYIEDSGIGIPEDKQSYIFEQFSRLSLSNKGLYKGLGIGLRVVKEFVEDLNADLDLKSEEGIGTVFVVSIPFILPLTNDVI